MVNISIIIIKKMRFCIFYIQYSYCIILLLSSISVFKYLLFSNLYCHFNSSFCGSFHHLLGVKVQICQSPLPGASCSQNIFRTFKIIIIVIFYICNSVIFCEGVILPKSTHSWSSIFKHYNECAKAWQKII